MRHNCPLEKQPHEQCELEEYDERRIGTSTTPLLRVRNPHGNSPCNPPMKIFRIDYHRLGPMYKALYKAPLRVSNPLFDGPQDVRARVGSILSPLQDDPVPTSIGIAESV